MSKRTIQIIIGVMSIALLGITIIQGLWLKRSIEINGKNFDDRVLLALNRVKQQLENDANDLANSAEILKDIKNKSTLSNLNLNQTSGNDTLRNTLFRAQLNNVSWYISPNRALETINPKTLDQYMRKEMQDEGIDINYNYGVYANNYEDFIIMNGAFKVLHDRELQNFSSGGQIENLYNSVYQVKLFNLDDEQAAGSLRVFFPRRGQYLISSILPAVFTSLILTALIIGSFFYTINIILTQKKVSQMKTDFINNMTHEFKTPIATISLATDSIMNPAIMKDENKIRRFANIIKQENNRMLSQVEKVLQIAKIDKEKIQLKLTDININDLIEEAVEHTSLKISILEGDISFTPGRDVTIAVDENHISNVMHNLLDNAVKYSNGKPFIKVSTKLISDGVEICVKDKGIGMSNDETKRIFEKFYRVSTGNLHDVKGFGLGLSYVKNIVEAHGGKVKVESEIGKGSAFYIILPLEQTRI